MQVTLLRHYKVNYTWKGKYTPEGFRIAQHEYDAADVTDQKIKLPNHFQKAIISNLKRTSLTLKYVLCDCDYLRTELLNEVPMEAFTDKQKEYSLAKLTVMARIQWLFNSDRQRETRRDSIRRANRFIEEFLSEDGNYLIVGHGFFLRLLSREMLKRGFKGKAINYIRNGEYFTYELNKDCARDSV